MKDILLNMKDYTKFSALDTFTNKRVRCMKEGGESIFVYGYRRKRYGRRYSFIDSFLIHHKDIKIEEEDNEEKWKRRLRKASGKLEKTGLWPEFLEVFENLQSMSFEDWEKFKEDYWSIPFGTTLLPTMSCWKDKYPFLFYTTKAGKDAVHTDYINDISRCKMKSMYFGKYLNRTEKENIKHFLAEKKDYSTGRIQAGYDVSFEYRADKNKAWYSEEYRGCGNGHYYIALDHSTALHVEDD